MDERVVIYPLVLDLALDSADVHHCIRLTPDCGAPVYDHTLAPRAKDDVILDPNRADDYAILDADDILYSNYKNEGE